jgi:hypothetical protein
LLIFRALSAKKKKKKLPGAAGLETDGISEQQATKFLGWMARLLY